MNETDGGVRVGATPEPLTPWRCFHCDEVFTDKFEAEIHFGRSEHFAPMCLVDAIKYREMEERVRRHNEEDSELHREIHRLESKHHAELQREEEAGYAKGLRDAFEGAPESLTLPPTRLLAWSTGPHATELRGWYEKDLEPLRAALRAPEPLTAEPSDETLHAMLCAWFKRDEPAWRVNAFKEDMRKVFEVARAALEGGVSRTEPALTDLQLSQLYDLALWCEARGHEDGDVFRNRARLLVATKGQST